MSGHKFVVDPKDSKKNKAAKSNEENSSTATPVRRNRPYGYEYSQALRPRAYSAELRAKNDRTG